MDTHHILGQISHILVIIGALNWGSVGAFGVDVVARIFGPGSAGAKVVYILIGLAAIVLIALKLMSHTSI